MMAAGGEELAAELHLEWMAGIIVNYDSHRGMVESVLSYSMRKTLV